MDNKNCLLILGMHRSGTSCLAGSLQRCGLYLGKVQKKSNSNFNKKGNYENREVYKIQDQILRLNKGSWYCPPINKMIVHPYHVDKLKEVIDELRGVKIFGIKDPRTLLCLDTWKEILNKDFRMVGSFRHPMSVAKSLENRNGIPIDEGLELWKVYNRRLIDEHKKCAFPLIHFDLSDIKVYKKSLMLICQELQLRYSPLRLYYFLDEILDHYSNKTLVLPDNCKDQYNYLLKNVIQ